MFANIIFLVKEKILFHVIYNRVRNTSVIDDFSCFGSFCRTAGFSCLSLSPVLLPAFTGASSGFHRVLLSVFTGASSGHAPVLLSAFSGAHSRFLRYLFRPSLIYCRIAGNTVIFIMLICKRVFNLIFLS